MIKRIKILPPKPVDVVIYDSCGCENIIPFLKGWSTDILHTRRESINILVLVLAFFFKKGRHLSESYVDIYIRFTRPKLVITYIDNNPAFYQLKKRFGNIIFMAVQNGWRSHFGDLFSTFDSLPGSEKKNLQVDYMMTLGEGVSGRYREYVQGETKVIGSIKSNSTPQAGECHPGEVVFISQWSNCGFELDQRFYTEDEFFRKNDSLILNFLSSYTSQKKLNLKILLRNTSNCSERRKEEEYYKSILGSNVEFAKKINNGETSYQVLDRAEVVICVDSTLGYEMASRGTRTAFFSIRGEVLGLTGFSFGWPAKIPTFGPFWASEYCEKKFRAVMDYVVGCTEQEWDNTLKRHSFSNLISYDPENAVLELTLKSILGAPQ